MAEMKQSQEELANLFFCSLEEDPTGVMCEELAEELSKEGFNEADLMKAQQEATKLFASNCY